MAKAILAGVLALLLLPCLSFADTELATLGGFVASAVIDNEDTGLVDIEGIRAALYDVDLPFVEDLTVYLRWQGGGEHTITVTLINGDTEDIIEQAEEEIDFEEWSTTYTTHELSNVVFEDAGWYDVIVSVDGEDVLDIPYFVNAETDGDYPEDPWLLASVPAIDGYTDEAGEGVVEGVFEHFTFKKLPDSDDFAIVTLWFSGDGWYEHRVVIRDPAGKQVAASDTQELDAWPGEVAVLTDSFENFLFRTTGDYEVAIFLDDEEYFSYILRVVKTP